MLKKTHQIVVATNDPKKKAETLAHIRGEPVPTLVKKEKEKKDENDVQKPSIVKTTVRDRIRRERTEFGWKQDELDLKAGVPKNTVKSYEAGTAVINAISQTKILRVLDMERTKRGKDKVGDKK